MAHESDRGRALQRDCAAAAVTLRRLLRDKKFLRQVAFARAVPVSDLESSLKATLILLEQRCPHSREGNLTALIEDVFRRSEDGCVWSVRMLADLFDETLKCIRGQVEELVARKRIRAIQQVSLLHPPPRMERFYELYRKSESVSATIPIRHLELNADRFA